ncbi:MAG: hypothetical protein ACI9UN_002031 [Granulosicoccus sp.]|jgi:hypothetical protein
MAMKHLAAEDVNIRIADRYLVVVHVDADNCSVLPVFMKHGDPLSIGRMVGIHLWEMGV